MMPSRIPDQNGPPVYHQDGTRGDLAGARDDRRYRWEHLEPPPTDDDTEPFAVVEPECDERGLAWRLLRVLWTMRQDRAQFESRHK